MLLININSYSFSFILRSFSLRYPLRRGKKKIRASALGASSSEKIRKLEKKNIFFLLACVAIPREEQFRRGRSTALAPAPIAPLAH